MLTKKAPKRSYILDVAAGTFAARAADFAVRVGRAKLITPLAGWQVALGVTVTIATSSLLLYALTQTTKELAELRKTFHRHARALSEVEDSVSLQAYLWKIRNSEGMKELLDSIAAGQAAETDSPASLNS